MDRSNPAPRRPDDQVHDSADATRSTAETVGEPVGLFYTWWRGDRLPGLPELSGIVIKRVDADQLVAVFTDFDRDEASGREERGHHPYVATINEHAVAYGWSATREARIGELGVTLDLSGGNRYLWDFVTLPNWRGRGIYPLILQEILRAELEADHFWIGHDRPNVASGSGIIKAGFQQIGSVYQLKAGGIGFALEGPDERSRAANALLGLPVIGDDRSET